MFSESSYNPKEEGKELRVSKSSYMAYTKCARLYWWRYIKLRDLKIPPNEFMIKGSAVHDALEVMYDEPTPIIREGLPSGTEYDTIYDTMAELEEQRKEDWGEESFKPLEHEIKWEVWDEENECLLVGKCDGVLLHPDGGVCLLELKTGNLNMGKLGRTRQELCFYARMFELMDHDYPSVTHFMYLSPECTDPKTSEKLLNQNRKKVWLGNEQGIAIVEKVNQRSINTFTKKLKGAVNGMKKKLWPMNWSDYYCPEWCEFNLSCDEELHGEGEDPTGDAQC